MHFSKQPLHYLSFVGLVFLLAFWFLLSRPPLLLSLSVMGLMIDLPRQWLGYSGYLLLALFVVPLVLGAFFKERFAYYWLGGYYLLVVLSRIQLFPFNADFMHVKFIILDLLVVGTALMLIQVGKKLLMTSAELTLYNREKAYDAAQDAKWTIEPIPEGVNLPILIAARALANGMIAGFVTSGSVFGVISFVYFVPWMIAYAVLLFIAYSLSFGLWTRWIEGRLSDYQGFTANHVQAAYWMQLPGLFISIGLSCLGLFGLSQWAGVDQGLFYLGLIGVVVAGPIVLYCYRRGY